MGKKVDVNDQYEIQELHESILKRPDTHVGSIREREDVRWVVENNEFICKNITYTPGLYKIFDEVLVNAYDETIRGRTNEIKVSINQKKGAISVWNNGPGIPVDIHKKTGVYAPQMIFGILLTSENYKEGSKRLTGGKNGYGAKLANIFSKKFTVETLDSENKKLYKQTFKNHMYDVGEPEITKVNGKPKGYVSITFLPDYSKFGLEEMTDDIYQLFTKRVYDLAMCCGPKIKVYFQDELITCNNMKKYVDMYYNDDMVKTVDMTQDRWKIAAVFSPEGDISGQVAFTNGICNHIGGTHVDDVFKQIIDGVRKKMSKKTKTTIRPALIKDSIMLFVEAKIENPDFDSQTKENLTSRVQDFGSRYKVPDTFIGKLVNSGLGESILNKLKSAESSVQSKTDGRKVTRITGIPKLEDATKAGTKDSHKCRLLLTEGDSAKTFAMSGFQVVKREYFGAFPLRGKFLNVQEATTKQLLENPEIIAIKKIMGLQEKKDYSKLEDLKKLRYGGIIILTDQDVDGFHIKGLLLNFFYTKWPSLKNHKDFIQFLPTPIVKATKGKEVETFYYLSEFKEWQEQHPRGWNIKYYKGLGTSTSGEAKECFKHMEEEIRRIYWSDQQFDEEINNNNDLMEQQAGSVASSANITYVPRKKIKDDDALELLFKKDRADDRKIWLMNYNPAVPPIENTEASVYDFANREMIHFSAADNVRSIMCLIDGLKPSQRKTLYTMFKRGLTFDKPQTKVNVLQGKITDDTDYHHGDAALCGTIVGMAQQFPGSNNVNLLQPDGQFGSRLQGGKDAASPRYIFTRLTKLAPYIFNELDAPVLRYMYSDQGEQIEPEYFVPVVPTILFNGGSGIGTGFSTDVPLYNPIDVVNNCHRLLDGKKPKQMIPWFRFFKGEVLDDGSGFICRGNYEVDKDSGTVVVTELPIKVWTEKYKEYLELLLNPAESKEKKSKKVEPLIIDYIDVNDDVNVNFKISFKPATLNKLIKDKKLEKLLKLTTPVHTTNMHLFNESGMISKYRSSEEILKSFAKVRLDTYGKRIAYLLDRKEAEMNIYYWKMKFIEYVMDEKIKVYRQKKDKVIAQLEKLKFPELSANLDDKPSYKYLTEIQIFAFTEEEIEKLKKKIKELEKYITYLKESTPESMWREELDVFVEKYEEWFEEESKRYWSEESSKKKKNKK